VSPVVLHFGHFTFLSLSQFVSAAPTDPYIFDSQCVLYQNQLRRPQFCVILYIKHSVNCPTVVYPLNQIQTIISRLPACIKWEVRVTCDFSVTIADDLLCLFLQIISIYLIVLLLSLTQLTNTKNSLSHI